MDDKNFTIGVPADKPHYRKAFILFFLIDQAFLKINLQVSRIEIEKKSFALEFLFADIHFFLIAVSNLQKVLKKLLDIIPENKEYKLIYDKYSKDLDYLNNFRNHLEHIIDGRIDGKNRDGTSLKQPNMLGNLLQDNYDFGGESFNLKESFKLLDTLLVELKNLNKNAQIYPLWNI